MADPQYSVSPEGERFPLPGEEDYEAEDRRLRELVEEHRREGREIVVLGLRFVGAVMAAIVADAEDAEGRPAKLVVGKQRPSTRSYWKIPLLNRGECPIKSEDPEVERIIRRTVSEKRTLTATFTDSILELADTVVVDIQCDYRKRALGDVSHHEEELREAGHRCRAAAGPQLRAGDAGPQLRGLGAETAKIVENSYRAAILAG